MPLPKATLDLVRNSNALLLAGRQAVKKRSAGLSQGKIGEMLQQAFLRLSK
jgi:hypothetical protein